MLGTVCSLLQTTITMFSRFVSVSVRLSSVLVKKKLKSNVLFWLKTCMLFVGLSSFKGTNTCIPAVCACNSCDSCISRIENQYPETQHDWLHYIHNFLVIANSCKSKPNLFFYLTIKKLDLDYGLKTLINLKTVGLGNKRTWWNRTVSRSMHNRCFFRPRRCYRSRRNDRRFILDVP